MKRFLQFFLFLTPLCLSARTLEEIAKARSYDTHLKDYAKEFPDNTCCVCITTYNRADYFEQQLRSLEKNEDIDKYPVLFFLDGGKNATQEEHEKLIKASTIPNKVMIKRDKNYGNGKNIIDSRRFVFDWCGFAKAVILVDDIILAPYHLNFLNKLDNWVHDRFDNVGTVQTWNLCFLEPEEKKKVLPVISESFSNTHDFLIRKSVWDQVKDFCYEYEEKFLYGDQDFAESHSKDSIEKMYYEIDILDWQEKKAEEATIPTRGKHLFPNYFDLEKCFLETCRGTAEDTVFCIGLWLQGFVRVGTLVNRAAYIGVEGIFSNAAIYEDVGFGKAKLNLFKEDMEFEDFLISVPEKVKK